MPQQPVKAMERGYDVETPLHHHMHAEGRVSTIIEHHTSKIPSVGYLTLAVGFAGLSASLMMSESRSARAWGNFFGQWVPSILVIGLYNKLVKRLGH